MALFTIKAGKVLSAPNEETIHYEASTNGRALKMVYKPITIYGKTTKQYALYNCILKCLGIICKWQAFYHPTSVFLFWMSSFSTMSYVIFYRIKKDQIHSYSIQKYFPG